MNKESNELKDFKKKWVGKLVVVSDPKHPHYKETAEVVDIQKTLAGWGMKLRNDDNTSVMYGKEFYIFKGSQIKVL